MEEEQSHIFLRHRWSTDILRQKSLYLTESKARQLISDIVHEQNLTVWLNGWISEADLVLGVKLIAVMVHCPEHLVEAVRLYFFFESLLINHNLETLVTATMNSLQPRARDIIKDFTAINMWYKNLDDRFNFSVEPILTALSTNEQLTQLRALESPYLKGAYGSKTAFIDQKKNQALHLSGMKY